MAKPSLESLVAAARAPSDVAKRETVRETCGRCGGSGRIPGFSHVVGGVCFTCDGAGHFVRTVAAKSRSEAERARRERARAGREVLAAERVAEANAATAARALRYVNDPRIGPRTRARVDQFPAVAHEAYRALERVDRGEVPEYTLDEIRK